MLFQGNKPLGVCGGPEKDRVVSRGMVGGRTSGLVAVTLSLPAFTSCKRGQAAPWSAAGLSPVAVSVASVVEAVEVVVGQPSPVF